MKMEKPRIIEWLGIAGGLIWAVVILLRGLNLDGGHLYQFWLGTAPNIGAAWIMTMFGHWAAALVLKKKSTLATHAVICAGILVLALVSEILHDKFFNSPFDGHDILATVIAQSIMFGIVLLFPLTTEADKPAAETDK